MIELKKSTLSFRIFIICNIFSMLQQHVLYLHVKNFLISIHTKRLTRKFKDCHERKLNEAINNDLF